MFHWIPIYARALHLPRCISAYFGRDIHVVLKSTRTLRTNVAYLFHKVVQRYIWNSLFSTLAYSRMQHQKKLSNRWFTFATNRPIAKTKVFLWITVCVSVCLIVNYSWTIERTAECVMYIAELLKPFSSVNQHFLFLFFDTVCCVFFVKFF